jgi:hypothetical protein
MSGDHKASLDKQAQEISKLRGDIQTEKQKAFDAEKRHTKELNNLNELHAKRQLEYVEQIERERVQSGVELAAVRKLHREDCEARDQKHTDEVNRLNTDHRARLAQLQKMIDEKNALLAGERKANTEAQLKAQREYEAWRSKMTSENKQKVFKLQMELSMLVKTNKIACTKLIEEREAMRVDLQTKINDKDATIKKQVQDIAVLTGQVNQLTVTLQRFTDIERQRDAARQSEEAMRVAKIDLQNQLNEAGHIIQVLQNDLYESKRRQIEILKELQQVQMECEQLQQEIEHLKNYIIDLKSRIAVYIPVKDDKVDRKIAEYINNYPDRQKLKILFMRESEGVY